MKFATTLSLCLVISLASGCKTKDANKAAEPALELVKLDSDYVVGPMSSAKLRPPKNFGQ